MKWILLLCLLAPPALADTCPPVPDHSERLTQLHNDLAASLGQGEAQVLTEQLWSLWTDAPDDKAQAMLDEGMRKRSEFDFLGARDVLDQLVEYCPDFAEGYNQRAFASYLRQDFAAALIDLDRTLKINPMHIGALSGKGLTLMGLGRAEEAQIVLREALALNPWLQERALLTDPVAQDI